MGVVAKIFGGKVHSSSEFRVFRHLWSRYDAPCSSIMHGYGIAICHRRKFGQVWGSIPPLPEAAGNLRSRQAPLWTFSYRRRRFWHATLRLRSAIRRHHPAQRAVLSQICCFGERKVVMFQILLDGAEPCDAGTTWLSSPVCRRGG